MKVKIYKNFKKEVIIRKILEIISKFPFLISPIYFIRYYSGYYIYILKKILMKPYIGGYLFSDQDLFRARYKNIDRVLNQITLKELKILEIGSYCGQNTIFIGRLLKKKGLNFNITCLDIWDKFEINTTNEKFYEKKFLSNLKNGNVYRLFNYNIESCGLSDNIKVIKDDSLKFLSKLNDMYDIIIIDGSHTYEYVYNDILHSKKLLNNNGFIIGDDYEADYSSTKYLDYDTAIKNNYDTMYCTKLGIKFHPGVTKAVSELLDESLKSVNGQFIIKKIKNNFIDYAGF
tara:strand:- start:884 stop:1747 length:864 start_codon:yes stop_codon:yes gene_type:complete